ncbi:putative HxlR family transcriptional regulator [Gordonia rhizosphera NBRC 16068]|uniref:Putative HxlR family transcriptional regulator n=2 Tax=Gordonia rhizosphera TaxID=83341 RepID=K6VWU7_9ACTN|nr:putative HxlR family transcriptional regulator [Gordonia rhizosphera NBRC 16068]
MDVVGDSWTVLVLREIFYGIRRFDDIQRELGIARNTLVDRLKKLVDAGVLERHEYQSEPRRHEYVLTPKGADLWGVLLAITQWGDRWMADESGPPITLHHTACGHDTSVAVVCEHCGEPIPIEESRMSMGPGYPEHLRDRPDIVERFRRVDAAHAPE